MGRVTNFLFFGLFLAAFVLFILAFSCPFWYEIGNESYGLFKECYRDSYGMAWICTHFDFSEEKGQVIGAMVMMVLALMANIAAFFISILIICRNFKVLIGAIVCGAGAVMQLLAIGIFGSLFDGDMKRIGWSFALACISMGLQAATCITVILAEYLKC